MKVTCIGSAGGYPLAGLPTTSYLVSASQGDYHLLVDAGSGSALAIEQYLDVNDLDAVWLSHDHPDHSADIGIFQHLFFLKKPASKKGLIPIYLNVNSKLWPNMMTEAATEPRPYAIGQTLDLGPFKASFIKTTHPVECAAIKLEETATGKVLVYTADSGWQDSLVDFAKGADVLIADTNFPNERGTNPIHMTAEEVARLANQAQVQQLLVSHIPPQADAALIMNQVKAAANESVTVSQAEPGGTWQW